MSVVNAVLSYVEVTELQYDVTFVKARLTDIVGYILPSRYLSKQEYTLFLRHVRLGRLMTRIADVLPLLESPNDCRKDGKGLSISHVDREVVHGTRNSFVVLLSEFANLYISNCTKSTASRASVSTDSENSSCKICTIYAPSLAIC